VYNVQRYPATPTRHTNPVGLHNSVKGGLNRGNER
jgi:hypothetical protein